MRCEDSQIAMIQSSPDISGVLSVKIVHAACRGIETSLLPKMMIRPMESLADKVSLPITSSYLQASRFELGTRTIILEPKTSQNQPGFGPQVACRKAAAVHPTSPYELSISRAVVYSVWRLRPRSTCRHTTRKLTRFCQ